MSVESILEEKFRNAHLSEGKWGKDEKIPSEFQVKNMIRRTWHTGILLAVMAAVFFGIAYLFDVFRLVFIVLAVSFLLMFLIVLVIVAIGRKKVREAIKELESNPAQGAIHEIRQHETVRYYSGIMVDEISDKDMLGIAACIKEGVSDETEAYTFNVVFSNDITLSDSVTGKQWVLHDGYSPFFINLGKIRPKASSGTLIELDIYIIADKDAELRTSMDKIREAIRKCVMKNVLHSDDKEQS